MPTLPKLLKKSAWTKTCSPYLVIMPVHPQSGHLGQDTGVPWPHSVQIIYIFHMHLYLPQYYSNSLDKFLTGIYAIKSHKVLQFQYFSYFTVVVYILFKCSYNFLTIDTLIVTGETGMQNPCLTTIQLELCVDCSLFPPATLQWWEQFGQMCEKPLAICKIIHEYDCILITIIGLREVDNIHADMIKWQWQCWLIYWCHVWYRPVLVIHV